MQCTAQPCDLLAALLPTQLYWQTLQSRIEDVDATLAMIATTPMFQHTYGSVHGCDPRQMIIDLRSATGLLASNVFNQNEIEVFCNLNLAEYLNPGLALAARHLRPRAPTIPDQIFANTVRMAAFTFVLRLIGEDLKNPGRFLEDLIARFDLGDREKLSLYHATMANCHAQSSKIVHH